MIHSKPPASTYAALGLKSLARPPWRRWLAVLALLTLITPFWMAQASAAQGGTPDSAAESSAGETSVDESSADTNPGLPGQPAQNGSQPAESPQQVVQVGLPLRIEQLVLPGSELEPRPWKDSAQPGVLRIVDVYPHGSDMRYDIEFFGLETGQYDLRDFLQRKDGSVIDDLPSYRIEVTTNMASGQVEPHTLQSSRTPRLSHYRIWALLAIGVWILGLVLVVRWNLKKPPEDRGEQAGPPPSLATRLRPLVTKACRGELSGSEAASLERTLISYWRQRLKLEDLPAETCLQQLRDHPEAGQILSQVEIWLHHPDSADESRIAELLRPYENVPDELVSEEAHIG